MLAGALVPSERTRRPGSRATRPGTPSGSRRRSRLRARSDLAVALALEAERLVEPYRRLVPREDVELELPDPRCARPLDRLLQQPRADPRRRCEAATISPRSATCALDGCGSRASERRADDVSRRPPRRTRRRRDGSRRSQVAALVADRPPAVGREDPAAFLAGDLLGEGDERGGIGRAARRTVITAPPVLTRRPPRRRRVAGRPLPASVPSGRRATAWTPPKKRFDPSQRTTFQSPGAAATSSLGPAALEMERRILDMQPGRVDRLGDGHAAEHAPGDLGDRSGKPHRARASEDERGAGPTRGRRRGHHARRAARPGLRSPRADHVELAEHVVELRAAAEDARPRAERRRERRRQCRRVDDGDVRRPGERALPRALVGRRDRARLVVQRAGRRARRATPGSRARSRRRARAAAS